MIKVSADRLDIMEEAVKGLSYRLGDNYDSWFPSIDDIEKMRPIRQEDLPFLIWVMYPRNGLTPEQKQVKQYIRSVLAEEIEFESAPKKVSGDEEAAEILKKFAGKGAGV